MGNSIVRVAEAMAHANDLFRINRGCLLNQSTLLNIFAPTEYISRESRESIRASQNVLQIFCSLGPSKKERWAVSRQ
jgi:hypothetical protein